METKKIISRWLIAGVAIGLTIGSCKKEQPAADDTDTQAASDNAQAESVSNDVTNMADQAAANGTSASFKMSGSELFSPCATIDVSKDTVILPSTDTVNTITIDFRASCLCKDNRYRKGQIIITQYKRWWQKNSYRMISFNGYFVGKTTDAMHQIEGTHKVTFNGPDLRTLLTSTNTTNPTWTIEAKEMKITAPNGKYHTWNSTRTREWSEGYKTPNWLDDVYLITGGADGTNSNGSGYKATITSALKRKISCSWFVSGTVEITPTGKKTRTVDFGNGTCDDKATVTIGSKTYNITK